MIVALSEWLINVTGYDALLIQYNSNAKGKYAGLFCPLAK
tara:strand:+ start:2720 stop:2839 length:120 start_codon:yes stop_codon:yes gene_type:complete